MKKKKQKKNPSINHWHHNIIYGWFIEKIKKKKNEEGKKKNKKIFIIKQVAFLAVASCNIVSSGVMRSRSGGISFSGESVRAHALRRELPRPRVHTLLTPAVPHHAASPTCLLAYRVPLDPSARFSILLYRSFPAPTYNGYARVGIHIYTQWCCWLGIPGALLTTLYTYIYIYICYPLQSRPFASVFSLVHTDS